MLAIYTPHYRRTLFGRFSAPEVAAAHDEAFAGLRREHTRRAAQGALLLLLLPPPPRPLLPLLLFLVWMVLSLLPRCAPTLCLRSTSPLFHPAGAPPDVLSSLECEAAAVALEGLALRLAAGAGERALAGLLVLLEYNFFSPEGAWWVWGGCFCWRRGSRRGKLVWKETGRCGGECTTYL